MLKTYFLTTKLLVKRPVIISVFTRFNHSTNNIRKTLREMEKKRRQQQEKSNIIYDEKLTPASINFIVLGNGGVAVPKSLFITTSEDSYLIGCSENSNRLATGLGIKPFKPKHIFITNNKWRNIGGLVGVGMNLELSGCDSITVHGPPKLDQLFYSSRLFGISAGIKIIYNPMDNLFKDCCFTVNKIELTPLGVNQIKRRKIDDAARVFNYHFKVNERIGRLDLNKCIELKVPVGPMLKKLKSGEDIELPDGKIIKHSDVCAPAMPGDEVLIIDCPTKAYLDSLIENEKLNDLINKKNSRLKYVFHFSEIDVVIESRYQDWVNKFSPEIKHIGLNENCSNLAHLPSHQQLYCLNKFDPEIFTQLYYDDKPKPIDSRIKLADMLEDLNLGLKKYSKGYEPVEMNFEKIDENLKNIEGLDEAIKEYKNKTKDLISVIKYPEIIFLGTASAAPGKYRNSSGIFINLNEKETCILDCGEGTLYEIIREFGPEKYLEQLRNLKFIFISHLHADHHIGLVNILLERRKSFAQSNQEPKKLQIFMPDAIKDFLKIYDDVFEPISDLFIPELLPHKDKIILPNEVSKRLGVEKLEITRVPHCYQSCAIALTTKTSENKDFKIAYSGDTLANSESLLTIGNDCDLLIHEATFSQYFEDEALKKRHSTSEQAIEMRDRMNAKFLILTHFSNRYAKIPLRSNKFDDRVGTAYDHMKLRPDNLKKSALILDLLEVLYKEDIDQSKSIIDRKKHQKELLKKYIREQ